MLKQELLTVDCLTKLLSNSAVQDFKLQTIKQKHLTMECSN